MNPIRRPWEHSPHDGRGLRRVYLNGEVIERVVYADTRRGLVLQHEDPPRIIGDRIIPRKRYGRVEVVPIGGHEQGGES